jgi:glutaredoxin-related protein
LAFTYLEYGSYTSQWHKRLALKMWSGWATFPMIFVDQTLIGGNAELQALLKIPDAKLTSLKRV